MEEGNITSDLLPFIWIQKLLEIASNETLVYSANTSLRSAKHNSACLVPILQRRYVKLESPSNTICVFSEFDADIHVLHVNPNTLIVKDNN